MEPHCCRDRWDKIQITRGFRTWGPYPAFDEKDHGDVWDCICIERWKSTAIAVYMHYMPFEFVFRDLLDTCKPNGFSLIKAICPWISRNLPWFVIAYTFNAANEMHRIWENCNILEESEYDDKSTTRSDLKMRAFKKIFKEEIERAEKSPWIYKGTEPLPRHPIGVYDMLNNMTIWWWALVVVELLDRMGHVSAVVRYMRMNKVCDEDIALWLSSMKINYSLDSPRGDDDEIHPLPGLVIRPENTEAWAAFHWEGRRLFRHCGEPETDALVLTRALQWYETGDFCLESILSEAMLKWIEVEDPVVRRSDMQAKVEEMARILRPDLDLEVSISDYVRGAYMKRKSIWPRFCHVRVRDERTRKEQHPP